MAIKKNDWFKARPNINLISYASRIGSHEGCIKINTNNSLIHEMTKLQVAYYLKKKGHLFLTEAKFADGGGIADVFDATTGIAYEVTHTETLEELHKKSYPVEIIRVKAGEFDEEEVVV